jgi:hypothetical protein
MCPEGTVDPEQRSGLNKFRMTVVCAAIYITRPHWGEEIFIYLIIDLKNIQRERVTHLPLFLPSPSCPFGQDKTPPWYSR